MDKQAQYPQLVQKRKACRLCIDLTNPSVCENGVYDQEGHIGPWTRWQGNLNAELMVIGQDWGGEDFYITHQGKGNDENATNKTICELLALIAMLTLSYPDKNGKARFSSLTPSCVYGLTV